jgi:Flp pilus assembly protein TadD
VGQYDKGDAIMTIFSGAGGDDSEDFSAMLLRMYFKYFDKKGWGYSVLHENQNDHGGYRNITVEINGPHFATPFAQGYGGSKKASRDKNKPILCLAPMADVKPQNLSAYASEEAAIEMLPYNESEFSRMLRIEKELTSVLNANPRDIEARNRFAALLMDRGEFQKARMFVNETISLFPEESEPMVIKALLERQEKNFDQAVKVLTEAIEINPENPNAHMLLGTVLSELGQRKPAEESLRRAVRLDPVNPLAHFNLSVAYLYQNPPYRALAKYHYNEAIRLGHPRDSEIEIRIQRTR